MTREDAAIVLGTLAAGFPDQTLEPHVLDLWTDELVRLEDNNVAIKAVRAIIRSGERFPSLAAIRSTYASLARDKRESTTALGEPIRPKNVPEWIDVWVFARRTLNDKRGFPQQTSTDGHSLNGDLISMDEYEELAIQWRQAGSPRVSNPLGEVLA